MKLIIVHFFASQSILKMNGTWIVLARYPDINAPLAPNQYFALIELDAPPRSISIMMFVQCRLCI